MAENKIFRIGWDIDGVLALSEKTVRERVSQELTTRLGRPIEIGTSDLTTFDAITKIALRLSGNQQFADQMTALWFNPKVLRLSPPNPAAIIAFRRALKLSDTEQHVITTRPPNCVDSTRDWLTQHLPEVYWHAPDRLIIRPVGDTRGGDSFKAETCQRLGIHLMHEDKAETIQEIKGKVPQCEVTYFSHPWNRSDLNYSADRVKPNNANTIYARILVARERFFAHASD